MTDTIAPRVTFDIDISAPYAELFKEHQMKVTAAYSSALLIAFGYAPETPARVRMSVAADTVLKSVHTLELSFPRTPEDIEVRGLLIGVTMALLVTLGKASFKGQDYNAPAPEAATASTVSAQSALEWDDKGIPAEMLEAAAEAEGQGVPQTAAAAPAYKLFSVQESSEVYAAESAEQARAFVSELIGEEIPENEIEEVDGSRPVEIYAGGAETFLAAAGVKLPAPESLRLMIAGDGIGALYLNAGSNKPNLTPRPLYMAQANISRIWLTQAEVAAASIADGSELPFMVCTAYE